MIKVQRYLLIIVALADANVNGLSGPDCRILGNVDSFPECSIGSTIEIKLVAILVLHRCC